jgi:hypothetical protein
MPEEGVGITRRPSWLETLRQHARDWGWKRAIYWQIMQPLGKRLGFHIHYVQVGADRPDLDDPVAPEIPPGYTARLGCKEDFLPALDKIRNLDQAFVDEAFHHDDECTVTFYGDELVAFSFNTRVKAPVTDQLEIVVPAGFRYGYKSWTHPDHRRNNLSAMGGFVKRTQGMRPFDERGIWYVETHNYPSALRSYRRPSERAIMMGLVGWFTIFGRQIPFASRHAKWIGFCFTRKDAPRNQYYLH